jgi:LmbE family N-acetylglucosaminyl deacetylase
MRPLFGAFTLIREHPLVVIITDSWVQLSRGITADQRWEESRRACAILGCEVMRMGLRDDCLTTDLVEHRLRRYFGCAAFDRVYAPAIEGGHPHHDMVGTAAVRVWSSCVTAYATYTPTQYYSNRGARAVHGSAYEHQLKQLALAQYPSQVRARPHFDAVRDRPEWLTP